MAKLPLLLMILAVPLWAQEDGGGDEEQQTATPAPATRTTGDDGGPNAIGLAPAAGPGFGQGSPSRRQTQPASLGSGGGSGGGGGGGGSAGGGGRFGSRPTASAYGGDSGGAASGGSNAGIDTSKKKVLAVYAHHKDMPDKQMSYGIFRVRQYSDAYSVAFYTGKSGGRMEGHYCTIVRAATSPRCTWQAWISEAPGGKALCAAARNDDVVESPASAIVTPTYPLAKLKAFLGGGDASKAPDLKDWCMLKPEKTYYCNVSAAGFTGDKEAVDLAQFRPTSSNPCIGLKASSPYDTPELAEAWQASRPH